MLKPEIHVELNLKGAEMRWNGGTEVQKCKLYPAVASGWLPLAECESMLFKVGRREFAVVIERVRKPKRGKRG